MKYGIVIFFNLIIALVVSPLVGVDDMVEEFFCKKNIKTAFSIVNGMVI